MNYFSVTLWYHDGSNDGSTKTALVAAFTFISIREKVSHRANDLLDILRLIEASIILHNFLVKQGDNDADAWEEEDGDVSDADDP